MNRYTYRKYDDTDRKYSKRIEIILKNDPNFVEDITNEVVDWSDKNSKSRVKDYYPFTKVSFVDKKYLPLLFPNIIPNTYINGDFETFVKKSKRNVFFLKPASKYIGGSNGIEISNDPYKLYDKFIPGQYVIQEEINPMLINGYKFDIRIYVLIVYNNKYIHVYYNYGIVRYCKEPYLKDSTDPDRQITIHGKYENVIDNVLLKPYLNGFKDIIYQTLLDLKPPRETGYQYLGYDIIISKDRFLYLLEINIQPSLKRVNYDIDILNNFTKLIIKPVLTNNRGYKPFMSFNNNIILSELNMSHLSNLYNITKQSSIMKYLENFKTWSYKKTKQFIEDSRSTSCNYYRAIITDNKLIGIIGIVNNDLTLVANYKYMENKKFKYALDLFLLTVDNNKIFANVLNTNTHLINFYKESNFLFITSNNMIQFKIR